MMKPQLAMHLYKDEEKKKPKHAGLFYGIFEKHDGWYGYLDFPGCVICSRALREIPSLEELSNKIRQNKPQVKGRLIFEIMIEGLEVDSFPELNGILNRKREQAEDAYLLVHDFLPDFKGEYPFETRYKFAQEIVGRLNMSEVRMSPLLLVANSPDLWREKCEELWAQGKEGIVGKRMNAPYSFGKRNADIIKIKEELTLELRVVGMYKGEAGGKYENTLGGLIVREKSGVEHRISGMTDEERDDWWKTKSILNKVVEVRAMKRLKDGSLREPRFKAIRYDKSIKDID